MRTKSIQTAALILLAVTVSLPLIPAARAQEGEIQEPFDDPALPGWEHSGEPSVAEGILSLPEGSQIHSLSRWEILELVAQVRILGGGEFTLSTHHSEEGALTVLAAREYLAVVLKGQVIHEAPIEPIPEGEWFLLTLFSDGQRVLVEINGQALFEEELVVEGAPGAFSLGYLGPGHAEVDFLEGGGLPQAGEEPGEETKEESAPTSQPDETGAETSQQTPAYQAGSWIHLGGPIGGLGYDIRYNFDNHDIWYATDAWAGIHRSQDDGQTWQPINQGITATKGIDGIPVFCATVDPHDPQVIWLGTEGTGQIYRSENGGDSWTDRSNGISQDIRPLTFRGITVHPDNPDILYAMAEISSPGWTPDGEPRAGIEMDLTQGIVYKTTDGGQNWQEIWRGNNLARYAWINPDDPQTVYVSTGIFDRESAITDVEAGQAGGVGILKSSDGGQTWSVIDQDNGLLDLYVGSLYMHPQNPDILLAAAAQNNWSAAADEYTGGIFLTEDGGESWERVISGAEMYGSVEFCETDPQIAYAASLEAVYRSQDGGHTWQRYSRVDNTWGPPGIIAGIPIDIQCDPDDTNRIFINNYGGGNFLSEDGGQTWVNASQGYSGALVRQIAVVPGQAGWVYTGARSGLFRSTDGGQTWQGTAYPGESMAAIAEITTLALDPSDPLHLVTSPDGGGGMIVSQDGGNSWKWADGDNFQAWTMAQAPGKSGVLYAGNTREDCALDSGAALIQQICQQEQQGFFRSDDSGSTWQLVSQEPLPDGGFSVLAVHPTNDKTIYGGTFRGSLAVSRDGGLSWTTLGKGLKNTDAPVSALALDPFQPDTMLLGLQGAGLYKSLDGGQSWSQVAVGLDPEAPINDIVFDPAHSDVVYLADPFSGVHYSTDGGDSWQTLNDGLTHRSVNTLGISSDGSVIYAGIEGAGVYRLGTPPAVDPSLTLPDAPASSEDPVEEGDQNEEQAAEEAEPAQEEPGLEPDGDELGDQEKTLCPTSYAPLLLAAGAVWLRRRKFERS